MRFFKATISLVLAVSCVSVVSSTLTFKTQPVIPDVETAEVQKNFKYLIGLIHNNLKWVTDILQQIKLERTLRNKTHFIKEGTCEWCLIRLDVNETSENRSGLNRRKMTKEEIAVKNQQLLRLLLYHKTSRTRHRRSIIQGTVFHSQSRSVGTSPQRTLSDQNSRIDRFQEASGASHRANFSTSRDKLSTINVNETSSTPTSTPVSVESTSRPSSKTTRRPVTPTNTPTPLPTERTYTYGAFPERDDRGHAIVQCTERDKKHFCLHGGRCIIVKILEYQTCQCSVGFTGRRCHEFDYLKVAETIEMHSDIRSLQEINDPNERNEMTSAITATAIYTVNAFLNRFQY